MSLPAGIPILTYTPTELVSSYYIKASRNLKYSSLKDYKILKKKYNLLFHMSH